MYDILYFLSIIAVYFLFIRIKKYVVRNYKVFSCWLEFELLEFCRIIPGKLNWGHKGGGWWCMQRKRYDRSCGIWKFHSVIRRKLEVPLRTNVSSCSSLLRGVLSHLRSWNMSITSNCEVWLWVIVGNQWVLSTLVLWSFDS